MQVFRATIVHDDGSHRMARMTDAPSDNTSNSTAPGDDDEAALVTDMPEGHHLADNVSEGDHAALRESSVSEFIDEARIRVPTRKNKILETVVERINDDRELKTWWHVANVNAVARMQMNDHSWVHMQIVTNIGLKLLRLLMRGGVETSMVSDYNMTRQDSEVVVLLGCLLHDVGMSIHRRGHEEYSLFLAERKSRELLEDLYPLTERTVMVSEVLQSIISHRSDGQPFAIESGVVRVADALDMSNGRSRIPWEEGSISIHALSAAAIEKVTIKKGRSRAILIEIDMNNSSGVYQVDELLKAKLTSSGLEQHFEVEARVHEQEKSLVRTFTLGD